jgi:putative membrane protein
MILLRWFLSAVTLLLVGYLVPGVHVTGIWAALIAALVLGILNVLIKPLLILLTLPITILTLGLFTLIINAGIFLLASTIVKGFSVDSFGAASIGSLLLWLINWSMSNILRTK